METKSFDLAIIGSGPGGYVAAIRAAQLGLSTALVEAEELGGACLNWGCIPTKALLKNASVLNTLLHADRFGIEVSGIKPDYGHGVERAMAVVKKQTAGLGFLMKKNGITVFKERAKLAGPGRLILTLTGQEIRASHLILATGARPRMLPGLVADGQVVFTAREALQLRELPARMIILGGGAIGCEFAHVFHTYGCEVTLIEMAAHLLPREDPEVAMVLERAYRKNGIEVLTGQHVLKAVQSAQGVTLELAGAEGPKVCEAPCILVGIGAMPNTEDLGLETVALKTDRGFVVVDEWGRTNVPNLYAIGDVTGKAMLAHVASAMGVACVEHLAGLETVAVNFDRIPSCTYGEPQVASIGLTEEEAKRRGLDVKIGRFPFAPNGKAQALGETDGFVKLVVDAAYGEIVGAHMVGPEVTELLAEISLGMTLETTPLEIERTLHAHPTLSETIKEAALAAIGQPIHL